MKDFIFAQAIINTGNLPKPGATQADIDKILSIVFGVAGSIAVMFIVIGGLRYITAQGDPSGTAQAKKTIVYAIIGTVVTMAAYAIIKFVVLTIG